MRMRTVEISVGVFMLAGIFALILLALRVSGLSIQTAQSTYHVHAFFDHIGGLKVRSKVAISGVNVGKVVSISYDKAEMRAKVVMEIDSQVNNIPTDSTAAILTSGLLGEQYIGITLGGEEKTLQEGGEIWNTQPAQILEDLIGKFLKQSVKEVE
nr:outer membrane lipid asymmetry maintenance protein MlaD [Zooshikella ganghwensis]